MRSKVDGVSEDRAMEQNEGFALGVWRVLEVKEVSVGSQAADDGRAGRGGNGMTLVVNGDFAIIADADMGALAPNIGPPGTGGGGAQNRAFFRQGQVASRVRGGAEFAVDFVLVGVGKQLVEQVVGPAEFEDLVGGQERGQTFLPVVVTAFDFTFGLRSGGVAQGDPIEVEGGAQLGEGVGVVSVEEGMVVHVEGQGQAVGLESAGEEIEVRQESFAGIEAGAGVVAGGVVD